jgi:hypothetical protein
MAKLLMEIDQLFQRFILEKTRWNLQTKYNNNQRHFFIKNIIGDSIIEYQFFEKLYGNTRSLVIIIDFSVVDESIKVDFCFKPVSIEDCLYKKFEESKNGIDILSVGEFIYFFTQTYGFSV